MNKGDRMKKWISLLLTLLSCALLFYFREPIITFFLENYTYKYANVKQEANAYKKNLDISFVKETDNFFPKSRQDLLDIFYTSLNNGVSSFTYYCTDAYKDCMTESERLAKDNALLSNINNLVHPYNSYKNLTFKLSNFGKVIVEVEKQYTEEQITTLNNKVNEIYGSLVKEEMNSIDKIRVIHDYLIQNSTYDQEKADNIVDGKIIKENAYSSETAVGVLMQGYGICSGFSDAMEIFLLKMSIPTYKITSPTHIWNLVYLDGKWYHLDLTWDNPIVNGSGKLLLHDFFLIDTGRLKQIDTGHHNYDENIYKEALFVQ